MDAHKQVRGGYSSGNRIFAAMFQSNNESNEHTLPGGIDANFVAWGIWHVADWMGWLIRSGVDSLKMAAHKNYIKS